jgi:hypothetical protein
MYSVEVVEGGGQEAGLMTRPSPELYGNIIYYDNIHHKVHREIGSN